MSRPGPRHGDKSRNVYGKDDATRWRDQWRKGMTLSQIAQKAKVSIGTITRWMSKEGRGEI